MEFWPVLLLIIAGLISGFVNVLAGGGSLLVMPILVLMMDMSGPMANGTNRVAVLAQNITAVAGFRKKGFSDARLSVSLSLCALPGAAVGAWYGTRLDGIWFNYVLSGVMIGVMVIMAVNRHQEKRKPAGGAARPQPDDVYAPSRGRLIGGHVLMAAIGFYGGFIQAGVGFLLMAALNQVMGLDLVRVNMHKVFIVAAFTLVSVGFFAWSGNIQWGYGLILAAAMSAGGWIGSHVAVEKGEGFIRVALNVTLTILIIKLILGG